MSRELAAQCVLIDHQGKVFRLALDPAFANLRSATAEERLERAIQQKFGDEKRLQIVMEAVKDSETPAQEKKRRASEREQATREAFERDPNVMALKESFGAVVESVVPAPEE